MTFDYDFKMQIGASRSVVFERLLRIEHLSRWFCGWCRIDPKVGGAFKFGGETCIILPEQRSWDTTIDEGEVLRRFAFTWPIRASKTRVSYELEDRDTGKALLRAFERDSKMTNSKQGLPRVTILELIRDARLRRSDRPRERKPPEHFAFIDCRVP